MSPAVSIVLPVHDAAPSLPAALTSLVQQRETDWELLAIDDGSTDGSLEILQTLARRDRRVHVLARPHQGLVAALTAGIEKARGVLVARMDADDVCDPGRLASQRHFLDDHPAVGLVATRVAFGGDPVAQAGYARHVAWTNTLVTHAAIAAARFVESPLVHPSVMFRRDLVALHGGYTDGPFPEDYELWLRWLDRGVRMEKLPAVFLRWNDSPGRLSRRSPRYADAAFARVRGSYLARWLARNNPHHPEVVVWGAGRSTRRRLDPLAEAGVRVIAYIDIDPGKIGRRLAGIPVLAPDALPRPGQCFVIAAVGSHGAREQIGQWLEVRGWTPGLDCILAA
jgi:glycosyltransferase involved in cell wall biosynthesis